jgi:DinB superfamily
MSDQYVAAIDWHAELLDQLDFYWDHMFWPRLQGLTDEEYLWEPVDGCWSVRPAGDGTFIIDWASPEPDPPPVTTIGWRLCHIGSGILGIRASNHFGDGSLDVDTITWPGTAAAALDFVATHHTAWRDGVVALGEAGLARKCGPAEGPHSESPLATLILHINREVFHHGGEIALLRDLYRDRDQSG